MSKHLKSEKHVENKWQDDMIKNCYFKSKDLEKLYNPKTLGQIAKDNVKTDVKQIKME